MVNQAVFSEDKNKRSKDKQVTYASEPVEERSKFDPQTHT